MSRKLGYHIKMNENDVFFFLFLKSDFNSKQLVNGMFRHHLMTA